MSLKRPCLDCGKPANGSRCDQHAAAVQRGRWQRQDASRPSRHARGYDAAYDRNARIMGDLAWASGQPCCLCGGAFRTRKDITAQHLTALADGGTSSLENLAPAHSACNSRDGARIRSRRAFSFLPPRPGNGSRSLASAGTPAGGAKTRQRRGYGPAFPTRRTRAGFVPVFPSFRAVLAAIDPNRVVSGGFGACAA